MKRTILFLIFVSILLATNFNASAQGTAFTYQGRLNDGASPANGIYDLRFTVYDALNGGSAVSSAVTNAATGVSNGLFAVALDMGPGIFTGAERWLEIGVRTNGSPDDFTALVPRQPITATPYAIFSAASGSVSNGLIQDPLFLGTTGNTPLELFAGSQRALRLEPNTNGAPNVIGGSVVNQVDPGVTGATISGGGVEHYFGFSMPNRISADFSTIGGGVANIVQGVQSVIAGGGANQIQSNAYWSAIAGGGFNIIQTNAGAAAIAGGYGNIIRAEVLYSSIGGGRNNTNSSSDSFIGGGVENTIDPFAGMSAIGGGWLNRIHQGADQSVIAGGNAGKIYDGARESFIGGGFDNKILTNASGSFIGAGLGNSIGNNSGQGAISGGLGNSISNNTTFGTIGGGYRNNAGGQAATVAGGRENHAGMSYATVGGGYQNFASGNFNIANGDSATVAGGYQNAALGNNATVAGGYANHARGDNTAIGGGWLHTNLTGFGVIGGGQQHLLEPFARFSVIAGGDNNTIRSNSTHAVISGGQFNSIGTNAPYATIPGGVSNLAAGAYSFAAGRRAKAMHRGAFVWADSQDPNFASSASNQFLIRANGGVGIGTNNPSAPLEVVGTVKAGSFATTGTISGNGSGVTNVNAASLSGVAAGNFWQLSGNNVAPGQFLGSTNNQPLELRGGGQLALRLERGGDSNDGGTVPDGGPNIIGGAPINFIPPNVVGGTIAGGGATNYFNNPVPQTMAADFGAIGGGLNNTIEANATFSVIAGGRNNRIVTNSYGSAIGGGGENTIDGISFQTTIAGGGNNRIGRSSTWSAIGGGAVNLIGDNANNSTIAGGNANTNLAGGSAIGGGALNQILGGVSATISGGWQNVIELSAWYATIGGGSGNRVRGQYSGILNGENNFIDDFGQFSVVGGGRGNRIETTAPYATVAGGSNNVASGSFSTIAGGVRNEAIGRGAMVPGGERNQANGDRSFAAGYRAKAIHESTFVWADSTDADFSTFGPNQFIIRASGGVGIGTGNPSARLHVYTDTTSLGDNTAMFQAPNLGPNLSHIHHGTLGDWYIRSASSSGKVVIQDAGGRVGIGTSNPQQPLHLNVTSGEGMRIDSAIAGHNPAIYLNHTGFGGRNYRIASFGDNSSAGSFRIRDETAGADRLIIDANGQVTCPGNLAFGAQTRQMLNLWTSEYGIGVQNNTLYHRSFVNYAWYRNGTHDDGELNPGGGTEMMRLTSTELRVNGAFVSSSDRNVKAGFEPVDSKAILEKVAALPITRWHYTNDQTATPHVGPVAQDFHSAFGVGSNDKYIATVDADGVALAAIQGLNQKLDEELKRSREKDAKISALEERLAKLEEILTANQR